MGTATRDFAAEYLAARKESRRPGVTLSERGAAWRKSDNIARAARRAGVKIDECDLDEQARVELYG